MPKPAHNVEVERSDLSRRDLLRTTAAAGVLGALGLGALLEPVSEAVAADAAPQAFLQLSSFLTGQPLNPVLGDRFLAALAKRMPNLHADIASLQRLIVEGKAADMDAFLALPSVDPALMGTVRKIVSAWYLGVVGEPEDAELITYAEALMYRPTRGILPIPTYGPGPNAWGPNPVTKS